MNVERLFAAELAVQIHIVTVLAAVLMTLIILPLKKGTRLHRSAGWVWVVSMMITATVSFWINTFDLPWGFSPIHIFSVVTLISAPMAIYDIRRGRVAAHKRAMLGVALGGIGIGGAMAFTPGRLMWSVLFG